MFAFAMEIRLKVNRMIRIRFHSERAQIWKLGPRPKSCSLFFLSIERKDILNELNIESVLC